MVRASALFTMRGIAKAAEPAAAVRRNVRRSICFPAV